MKRMTRSRLAVMLAAALLVTGCGGGDDGDDTAAAPGAGDTEGKPPTFTYGRDDTAAGPAPAPEGAVAGGTVRVYDVIDYQHLDPQRIYSSNEGVLSQIISRTLTGYRQDGDRIDLVGDLATNTGVTKDGGKTWTYTLREGVAWEDGSPITSADVKYGLERAFVADYTEGPTYLQSWFADSEDFRKYYEGPYGGKSLKNVTTPNARTVVLKFNRPRPDVPFALAMPAGSPVKQSKDTRSKYTLDPFASGPYKIETRKIDKSMTLVRNTAWKAETDPIRTQFPDRYEFSFGELPLQTNQRLIAAAGDDAAAMTVVDNVSPEVLGEVLGNPELVARTVSGYTPYAGLQVINTKRITDIRVRKALMYAYPRQQVRQILGGPTHGDFSTTIGSPTLVGHEPFDLYQVPPEGDPEKAKQLLAEAGKPNQEIVYAYGNLPRGEQVAVAVVAGLERAGFKVVRKPIDPKTFSDAASDPNNKFDLYGLSWGADWPSGATVYPVLFDGRRIGRGGYNWAFLNEPAINKEMDEIELIADPVEAGKRWAALDRKILELVPAIPDIYSKSMQLFGPRIGGAFQDVVHGNVSLNTIFVKP